MCTACLHAGAAQAASADPQGRLRCRKPTFGVVAPGASQRAAFQEHGGSYSRTVVDGISFDIEDGAADLHRSLGQIPVNAAVA